MQFTIALQRGIEWDYPYVSRAIDIEKAIGQEIKAGHGFNSQLLKCINHIHNDGVLNRCLHLEGSMNL